MNFEVVIGANWGDEGKGLVTAQLTQKAFEEYPDKGVLNILFSGGAQRGHTVDYTKVLRHVYRHLGAGTLHGADTYMTGLFMVDPIMLASEIEKMSKVIWENKIHIYINEICRVTTPFDKYINCALERKRGTGRHGSCGMGIFECRKRYESDNSMPRYGEICKTIANDDNEALKQMKDKWYDYFLKRLKELDIEEPQDIVKFELLSQTDEMFNRISDMDSFWTTIVKDLNNIPNVDTVYSTMIFEGSQGIALSQSNIKAFPHLTPSNTTAQWALSEIMQYLDKEGRLNLIKDNDEKINIYYVSRSYFTRHGEDPSFKGTKVYKDLEGYTIEKDRTNLSNAFQGSIQFAPMDFNTLIEHIQLSREDCIFVNKMLKGKVKETIVFTHMNEVNDKKIFIDDSLAIAEEIGVNNCIYLYSPYVSTTNIGGMWI